MREQREEEKLYVKKYGGCLEKMRVGVSELQNRSFVWQMVFMGLLAMLGLSIPQIIYLGHTRLVEGWCCLFGLS